MRFLTLLFLIFLFPALAFAGSHKKTQTVHYPPPALPDTTTVPHTLKSSPMSILMLGRNGVHLEDTTLSELRNQTRRGYIQHRGDAGTSEYWICYSSPSNSQPARIWLSSGELGGSRHAITSIYAESVARAKETIYCPTLSPNFLPAAIEWSSKSNKVFDASFWLGTGAEKLSGLIGKPSAQIGAWWIYFYSGTVPIAKVSYDRGQIIAARVTKGKITALFESQTTTY